MWLHLTGTCSYAVRILPAYTGNTGLHRVQPLGRGTLEFLGASHHWSASATEDILCVSAMWSCGQASPPGDALQENTELRRQSEAAQERSTAAERRQQAEQHKQVLCLATAHPHLFAASLSSFWGCGRLLPNFSHV